MILLEARIGLSYRVASIHLPEDSQRHLSNLGLTVGSVIQLLSKTPTTAIVLVKSSRLAFDQSILSQIDVVEDSWEQKSIPLSTLEVGQFAYIDGIFAAKEAKRRLMDMGLTRHTKIYLRKVAPLGDPLEISLRGYELTLRKSEAQLISVIAAEKDEKEVVRNGN
ncbi:ferrous ion transport protein A [Streptococcus varani]|jgi:ferrous iron transport protein A|uniref:Ferrous ion transport protein A n=1 Tax=Streptococcus varani TaxID=1608583 RepID=A0A0E3WFC7_9STRE|nr:ferrous iron transport protein A [Streptococcus varani]CQR25276.1 ferrous ion transport protein A [Streptococcus varani]